MQLEFKKEKKRESNKLRAYGGAHHQNDFVFFLVLLPLPHFLSRGE
jgi:hypothetical protein